MWMVTSGKGLREDTEQAAFLVASGLPDDAPAYPAEDFRKRVVPDPSGSVMLADPVPVDHIIRSAGREIVARDA